MLFRSLPDPAAEPAPEAPEPAPTEDGKVVAFGPAAEVEQPEWAKVMKALMQGNANDVRAALTRCDSPANALYAALKRIFAPSGYTNEAQFRYCARLVDAILGSAHR